MKVYIAGPMSGIPDFNFQAFKKAAVRLRHEGHVVFSPAESSLQEHGFGIFDNVDGSEELATERFGFDRRKAFADDLRTLCLECDAIAMLPGWENSAGATAEYALASALGLKVIELVDA